MKNKYYTPFAALAGGLLAFMIFLNGLLSRYTDPFMSSLIVHLAGFIMSLVLWFALSVPGKKRLVSRRAPLWSYSAGIGGAMAVVVANIAVNSRLGLAGSLSCFILGQTVSALVIERLGLFGAVARKLTLRDALRVGAIMAGALLIINSGGNA